MFASISNHPSRNWSRDQLDAAQTIGGEIRDFPFPPVPPQADSNEIDRLADELLQIVLVETPLAALVQGEFVLTYRLVSRLMALGIPCYATASHREDYEFVQFRKY